LCDGLAALVLNYGVKGVFVCGEVVEKTGKGVEISGNHERQELFVQILGECTACLLNLFHLFPSVEKAVCPGDHKDHKKHYWNGHKEYLVSET
jgi:hypothetical protein